MGSRCKDRGRRGDCVPWSLTWTELSGKEKSVTVQDVSPEWNHSTLSQEPARNSNTRKSETYHPELPVLWVSTSEEKEDLLSGEEEESVGKFIHRSYFYTILCLCPFRVPVVPDHQGTGQGLLHPRL